MVAEPELQAPPESVRDHIMDHYQEHKHTYAKVWDRLRDVNHQWDRSLMDGRVALLKLSYINSVLSVRTPVHIHEAIFDRIMAGMTLEDAWKAGGGAITRIDHIRETLVKRETFEDVVRLIEQGRMDEAHKMIHDEFGYVATAKAPFTLANLGFTEKMCLDANVVRLLRAERPETKSVETYERLCTRVKEIFPELAQILEPYQLQWLLFDYQRFYRSGMEGGGGPGRAEMAVTRHYSWFDMALQDIDKIIREMDRLTAEAHEYGWDNYNRSSGRDDLIDSDPVDPGGGGWLF